MELRATSANFIFLTHSTYLMVDRVSAEINDLQLSFQLVKLIFALFKVRNSISKVILIQILTNKKLFSKYKDPPYPPFIRIIAIAIPKIPKQGPSISWILTEFLQTLRSSCLIKLICIGFTSSLESIRVYMDSWPTRYDTRYKELNAAKVWPPIWDKTLF